MNTTTTSHWDSLKGLMASFRYKSLAEPSKKGFSQHGSTELISPYPKATSAQAYSVGSNDMQHEPYRLSHDHERPKDRPWRSGTAARLPLISLTCLLLIIALSFSTITVLLVSDGKDVDSWCATTVKVAGHDRKWRISVNAWIALFNFVSLKAAAVIFAEAVTISWWVDALQGQTMRNLHFRWEVGASLFAIVQRGRFWGWICVASFAFTVLTGLEALLQTASTSKTVVSTNHVNMTAVLASALPAGFSGVTAATGHDTFGIVYLTPNFIQILRNYTIQSPIHLDLDGCAPTSNVSCATTLSGIGFQYTCNASRSGLQTPLSTHGSSVSQPVNTVFGVDFESGDWSILLTALWHDKPGFAGPVVANRNCTMRPARVEYPVNVTRSTVTLQPPTSLIDWTKDSIDTNDNMKVDKVVRVLPMPDYDERVTANGGVEQVPGTFSTLGGIGLAFSNLFASSITLKSDITNFGADIGVKGSFAAPYAQFSRGTADSQDILDNTFSSPMEELLADIRDIMFRISIATAEHQIADYIFTNTSTKSQVQSSNVPTQKITREGEYQIYHTVYETNHLILGIGMGLIFAAILAILPLYWGFWRLGRKVSLSPLEVAMALHNPSISNSGIDADVTAQPHDVLSVNVNDRNQQTEFGSNLPADEIVKLLGTKKVKYGEVGPNILGIGLSERTLAPRKGWRYH